MKTMRTLYDQCIEELDGVIEYAKCAEMHMSNDPELSKMYINMAKQEFEHAKNLHAMSKRLADSKIGTENIDSRLMELWEEMESAKINRMALAKAYIDNVAG